MNQQEPADAMAEREDILKHLVDDSIAKEAFVPHSGKTLDGRVRLVIDFPCAIDAIGWLAEAKGSWLVPDDVTLYQTDALDEINKIKSSHLELMVKIEESFLSKNILINA